MFGRTDKAVAWAVNILAALLLVGGTVAVLGDDVPREGRIEGASVAPSEETYEPDPSLWSGLAGPAAIPPKPVVQTVDACALERNAKGCVASAGRALCQDEADDDRGCGNDKAKRRGAEERSSPVPKPEKDDDRKGKDDGPTEERRREKADKARGKQ